MRLLTCVNAHQDQSNVYNLAPYIVIAFVSHTQIERNRCRSTTCEGASALQLSIISSQTHQYSHSNKSRWTHSTPADAETTQIPDFLFPSAPFQLLGNTSTSGRAWFRTSPTAKHLLITGGIPRLPASFAPLFLSYSAFQPHVPHPAVNP